ncbi:MAG TPA: hypothetical protein VEY95_08200 [Azospirillaceae bacterium]|nr:hypothetical protein [Azospirillaceae bacterium]
MTFGYDDRERRKRRQTVFGWLKTVAYLCLLGGSGAFAYQMGVEMTRARLDALTAEADRLRSDNQQLTVAVQQLQAVARTAEARAQDMERRYEQTVPQGELGRLLQIARERLAAGQSADRLAFVLANASTPRTCEAPETRRVAVQLPETQPNPNSAVRLANGVITVSSLGQPSRTRDGRPEGWFDPAKPVTVRFTPIGGRNESVATGVLPLTHTMVVNNVEWRFAVHPGPRSFVDVTADRCPLP